MSDDVKRMRREVQVLRMDLEKAEAERDQLRGQLARVDAAYEKASVDFDKAGVFAACVLRRWKEALATPHTAATPEPEAVEMLLGSNIQPSHVKIGDREFQLGEIVRMTVKRGSYDAEIWNMLTQETREFCIQKTINWLLMIEAEPGGIMAGNPDGPMGEFVRAELARQQAADSVQVRTPTKPDFDIEEGEF